MKRILWDYNQRREIVAAAAGDIAAELERRAIVAEMNARGLAVKS